MTDALTPEENNKDSYLSWLFYITEICPVDPPKSGPWSKRETPVTDEAIS